MKNKFKFFKGIIPIERDRYNGVTDPYLIGLSRDIWSYSDWISSVMLTNYNGDTEDLLIVDFQDIDGKDYTCRISIDGSFQLLQIFFQEDGEIDWMDNLDISEEYYPILITLFNTYLTCPKHLPVHYSRFLKIQKIK